VSRNRIIIAAVALLAASAGYFVAMLLSGPATREPLPLPAEPVDAWAAPAMDEVVGQPRPDFSLADATGRPVSVDAFDGEVLLVNFWASWCTPCTEEMPMLSEFQRDHAAAGVNVVGIALDDPVRARAFAQELELDYPVLFGLADAMLTGRRYGNRSGMLPYSVLVDAEGIVRWTRLGVLDRSDLEAQLAALPRAR
jgi:peroxiredoxin